MSNRFVNALTLGAGLAAGVMLVLAFLKARPVQQGVSATPPTPASSSTVMPPLYDVLVGVGGVTPIQDHPDVYGTSTAPTNPS